MLKKISIFGAAALILSACSITRPIAVNDNTIGTKTGSSKTTCLFSFPQPVTGTGTIIASGICLNKKYGVVEAVQNSGIKTIGAVDMKETNYYLFKTYELIVAGE